MVPPIPGRRPSSTTRATAPVRGRSLGQSPGTDHTPRATQQPKPLPGRSLGQRPGDDHTPATRRPHAGHTPATPSGHHLATDPEITWPPARQPAPVIFSCGAAAGLERPGSQQRHPTATEQHIARGEHRAVLAVPHAHLVRYHPDAWTPASPRCLRARVGPMPVHRRHLDGSAPASPRRQRADVTTASPRHRRHPPINGGPDDLHHRPVPGEGGARR